MNPVPELPRSVHVRTDADDFLVQARAVVIGAEVLVYIWGGEKPHIGAVAAAQPRPSLADPAKTSATASVLTYPGHKEDEIVKPVAEALSAACNTNVVVTAGIHWDNLGASAINTIRTRIGEITEKLVAQLQTE